MLNPTDQLNKLIDASEHPLVVFGAGKNDDATAAAIALKHYLAARHKRAEVISDNFTIPAHLAFLDGVKEIRGDLANLHKFTIKVDVSKTKIDTLSYDIKDGWLSIHLTPRQGAVSKNDLRTLQTGFKYDLIFVIGTTDLELLGNVFFNNTDLFYRTPIVNIDNRSNNEHYGSLNMVDLTATSVSEIVYRTFEQSGFNSDAETATAILAGMISRTRSFKTPNVTPQTLALAGKLMDMGADREKIVHNLYRTKTIATLRLWGNALTNLQTNGASGLVWTTLTRDDFTRSGANENDIDDLVSELIANSPEAKMILVLFEDAKEQNLIHGRLTVDKNFDALRLAAAFQARGTKLAAQFSISGLNLKDAEREAVEKIKTSALPFIDLI
jgi:phosphoesterase RecJ-like protein